MVEDFVLKPPFRNASDPTWIRLDSKVRSCYSLVSEFVSTVVEIGNLAYDIWTNIENYFRDNKVARSIQLEEQFCTLKKGSPLDP